MRAHETSAIGAITGALATTIPDEILSVAGRLLFAVVSGVLVTATWAGLKKLWERFYGKR